eukprot:TRINITY_DN477_c0_g1_i1.p1 TRINITY_DN477_c0_g1~~TRINITY_DN477_c0_g1_i1.p1  ORF type:complete len:781 (+),score=217.45 TRINITY_DN477_c0_g1_i1:3391-5733(+)
MRVVDAVFFFLRAAAPPGPVDSLLSCVSTPASGPPPLETNLSLLLPAIRFIPPPEEICIACWVIQLINYRIRRNKDVRFRGVQKVPSLIPMKSFWLCDLCTRELRKKHKSFKYACCFINCMTQQAIHISSGGGMNRMAGNKRERLVSSGGGPEAGVETQDSSESTGPGGAAARRKKKTASTTRIQHVPSQPELVCEGVFADEYAPRGDQSYSRKDHSLSLLCRNFVQHYRAGGDDGDGVVCLDVAAKRLDVERRRIYDVVNVLESLRILTRICKNRYRWNGTDHLPGTFDLIQKGAEIEEQERKELFGDELELLEIDRHPTKRRKRSDLMEEDAKDSSSGGAALGEEDSAGVDIVPIEGSGRPGKPATKSEGRKEKSLKSLSEKFLGLLLLRSDEPVSLEEAAKTMMLTELCIGNGLLNSTGEQSVDGEDMASGDDRTRVLGEKRIVREIEKGEKIALANAYKNMINDPRRLKTKVRRLYDIANVLSAMDLIQKRPLRETRKPAFQWFGLRDGNVLLGDASEGPYLRWKMVDVGNSSSSTDATRGMGTKSMTSRASGRRTKSRGDGGGRHVSSSIGADVEPSLSSLPHDVLSSSLPVPPLPLAETRSSEPQTVVDRSRSYRPFSFSFGAGESTAAQATALPAPSSISSGVATSTATASSHLPIKKKRIAEMRAEAESATVNALSDGKSVKVKRDGTETKGKPEEKRNPVPQPEIIRSPDDSGGLRVRIGDKFEMMIPIPPTKDPAEMHQYLERVKEATCREYAKWYEQSGGEETGDSSTK